MTHEQLLQIRAFDRRERDALARLGSAGVGATDEALRKLYEERSAWAEQELGPGWRWPAGEHGPQYSAEWLSSGSAA